MVRKAGVYVLCIRLAPTLVESKPDARQACRAPFALLKKRRACHSRFKSPAAWCAVVRFIQISRPAGGLATRSFFAIRTSSSETSQQPKPHSFISPTILILLYLTMNSILFLACLVLAVVVPCAATEGSVPEVRSIRRVRACPCLGRLDLLTTMCFFLSSPVTCKVASLIATFPKPMNACRTMA